ncbi:hypothetical protein ACFVWX_13605 [Streptomyces sp. NPDC058220]|uniref:hypothetical protein n=1 Tax=Streptomyces sp. NPDC058220 TaxID=3346387 RepID=UPI0036EF3E57
MPWISRTRLADMQARIEQLVEERDGARKDAGAHLRASLRTAVRCRELATAGAVQQGLRVGDMRRADRRIRWSRLALARVAAALTAETRRADALQRRLDDALGLNDRDVAAEDRWQERRTDKPKPGPGVTA